MDSRVSGAMKLLKKRRIMKRINIKNMEYFVLCRLIRSKMKEEFEDRRRQSW